MRSSRRADAIVVAAGASRRMEGADKLAAEVAGRPLLAWTLDAIATAREVERMVVVVAAERVGPIEAAPWLPSKVARVVAGGKRRQESVAAGLAALDALDGTSTPNPDRVVLVHDGARPLVTPALIAAVVEAVVVHGAAIPVVAVAETLKRVEGGVVVTTVERGGVAAAQTPQGARRGILRQAFATRPADGPDTWTDEAALLEACKIPVHAIDGDPGNFKVTRPDDLRRIEVALRAPGWSRIGFGHDRHSFGPGRPLAIGGIEVAGGPRLRGHSDGDVALHAVADALLGAAGLGDLGRLFPADERTPRGIASVELLGEVVRRLDAAGLRPAGIDLTILGSRPRLAARLDEMRDRIAAILGVPAARVSVKASTGNLDGMEGAGRGISAEAIALLESRP